METVPTDVPSTVTEDLVSPELGEMLTVSFAPLGILVRTDGETAVMVPPVPAVAVIVYVIGAVAVNVAVTVVLALIVTVQVLAVPEHEPPQAENVEPDDALAVRVSCVPEGILE